jgi:hypothetical protein
MIKGFRGYLDYRRALLFPETYRVIGRARIDEDDFALANAFWALNLRSKSGNSLPAFRVGMITEIFLSISGRFSSTQDIRRSTGARGARSGGMFGFFSLRIASFVALLTP